MSKTQIDRALHLHYQNQRKRSKATAWGDLRKQVQTPAGHVLRVPSNLADHPNFGDLLEAALDRRDPAARADLDKLLCHFDVEYYARRCVTIRAKTGQRIRPQLTLAQVRLCALLERQRLAGRPQRVIILKARQWGGSTATQIYASWLQLMRYVGHHLAVVAYTGTQARWLRGMHTLIVQSFPPEIKELSIRQYEKDPNLHYVPERDAIIGVGSVQNPDAVRSFTYHLLHLSEVGLWPERYVISGRNLAQALIGTVDRKPDTLIVLESTGKGRGTYFHETWEAATSGEAVYEPMFVPWFEHESYAIPLDDLDEMKRFAQSLTEYEWRLLEAGATLDQIAWYRDKRGEYSDEVRFRTEYPSFPEEAFFTSGRPVFAPVAVRALTKGVRPPAWRGTMEADERTGRGALKNVRFVEQPEGDVWVWRRPGDRLGGLIPADKRVVHRYAVFLDPGGRTDRADWWVATVIDRAWLLFGLGPEVVARWRAHTRPDLGAWLAAQLAAWYDNALLAIEINRYRRQPDWEPDWSLAVIEELRQHYANLFIREEPEKSGKSVVERIGFVTTAKSKAMIVKTLMRYIEEQAYTERDQRAIDEMLVYEYTDDGGMSAPEGMHDDIVISTAGALWLSDHMPQPVLVEVQPVQKRRDSLREMIARSPFAPK